MKVYNSVTIDIRTNSVIHEDSFEYNGPITLCKGGSTTINSIDEVYNSRMAGISEKELGMAEEYFQYWKSFYKPYEQAMIDSNMQLIPQNTKTQMQQSALQSKLYGTAGNINVEDKMNQAGADVTQQFGAARSSMERTLARQGVTPGSGRSVGMENQFAIESAKATAGARTQAARQAEDDNIRQRLMALQV